MTNDRIEALEAENERLRSALAGVMPAIWQLPGDVQHICRDAIECARKAAALSTDRLPVGDA